MNDVLVHVIASHSLSMECEWLVRQLFVTLLVTSESDRAVLKLYLSAKFPCQRQQFGAMHITAVNRLMMIFIMIISL